MKKTELNTSDKQREWIIVENLEEATYLWYETTDHLFSNIIETLDKLEYLKEFKVPWNNYSKPKTTKSGKKLHFGVGKPPEAYTEE